MKDFPWKTHYTFHNFPELKPFRIPKQGIQTWHDLKYELQDHINIKFECIDIVINNRKFFYDDKTLMEDIDIKKKDFCIALLKPKYKNDKEKIAYQKEAKQNLQKNQTRLKQILNDPQYKKALTIVRNNEALSLLYKDLLKQYSKWQILLAIKTFPNNINKIKEDLQSGEASKRHSTKIFNQERQYIDQFLQKQEIKQIKSKIFDLKKDNKIYGQIMLKLYDKYPKFRQIQINHQEYIQLKLLGKTLYEIPINQQVKKIFDKVSQQKKIKYLIQTDYNIFKNKHIKFKQEKQINQALDTSGNNIDKAQIVLEKGLYNYNINYAMTLKKKARINIVVQLFSKPDLQPIRQSLKGNKIKTQAFVNYIQNQNKTNLLLTKLIKKYKNFIISILSSTNCQTQQKLQNQNLIFQKQLSQQHQKQLITKIQQKVDKNLINQLVKLKYQQKIAASIVRASQNNIQKAFPYLYLNNVPKSYHFCGRDLQKQQIFLQKQFKKEKQLLKLLKNQQYLLLWLGKIKQTSPFLFEIIIRNKLFFDRIINGNMYRSEIKESKKK